MADKKNKKDVEQPYLHADGDDENPEAQIGSTPFDKLRYRGDVNKLSKNDLKRLISVQNQGMQLLESTIASRRDLGSSLGMSYSGDRDLYEALGWKKTLTYDDYFVRYKRDGVARRIIHALPSATWRGKPLVSDNTEGESPFEEKWKELVFDGKVFNIFQKADVLARIGTYSVIFLGFNDGLAADKPVNNRVTEVLYMTPYSEQNAKVLEINTDTKSKRFGKPEFYELNVSSITSIISPSSSATVTKIKVHWSRIIHVAESTLENEIIGTPALQASYNYLYNLDLISGGSGEMFWRGAFPGLSLNLQKDADFQMDMSDMQDELEAYINKMQRYIRTEGMDVKTINAELKSPRDFVHIQFQLISAATAIPLRLLTGSERGQLASTQDTRNWLIVINDRREDFAEPIVVRPYIDRLIEVGVIPEPNENKYEMLWDDLFALGEEESMKIAELKAKALKAYTEAAALGGEQVVPIKIFQKEMLKFSDELIQKIADMEEEMLVREIESQVLEIEE